MQKSEKENAGSVMKVSSNMLFFNSFYVNALFTFIIVNGDVCCLYLLGTSVLQLWKTASGN